MLKMYVFREVGEIEREKGIIDIFQRDRALCHYSLMVQETLNNRLPDCWLGKNGPVSWPPRSPDWTPLDFFLWGYIKNISYAD